MIGYITLGTNNIDKAREFYDALFMDIKGRRIVDDNHITLWGNNPKAPLIGVIKPHNGELATIGNGSMAAIGLDTDEMVSILYQKALSLGGVDEGEPGPRGKRGTVFAYCRDLDGNKLAFFSMGKMAK
ncbi:MAG: VOC family protein [Sneathiella sp.]